jgi:hypothetical protein
VAALAFIGGGAYVASQAAGSKGAGSGEAPKGPTNEANVEPRNLEEATVVAPQEDPLVRQQTIHEQVDARLDDIFTTMDDHLDNFNVDEYGHHVR